MKLLSIFTVSLILFGCVTIEGDLLDQNHEFFTIQNVGYAFGSLTQTYVEKNRSKIFNDSYSSSIYLNAKLQGSKVAYRATVVGGEGNTIDPDFPGENGVVFIFELPAGDYQLDHWSAKEVYTDIKPENYMVPRTFTVKAGEILYIGNIHMNLLFGKNLVGAPVIYEVVPEIRNKFEKDSRLIAKKYPFLPVLKVVNKPLEEGVWPQSDRMLILF